MSGVLKDFPPGPLDFYRKKASFDWKNFKIFLEGEDIVKFENDLYKELEKYTEDEYPVASNGLEQERLKTSRQHLAYKKIPLLSFKYWLEDLRRPAAASTVLMQFASSYAIKYIVVPNLIQSVILGSGTERHYDFIQNLQEGKIFGCFCLTEIGHGTNAKGMRTTATYDEEKKQFILHTPDFEAAKCWAGSLGQTATHAVVFAQLIIDGEKYGLHSFIAQIRDPRTLKPCPGVVIGDMGEKIGLNGVDNGFLMFYNYPIPKKNLLNRTGDVTDDGRYITEFTDPNRRYGASMAALSGTRAIITNICTAYGTKALTIAIRYAAVRRQFGPNGKEEVPVLEYQTHQFRLLPYLSAVYVLRIYSKFISENQHQFFLDQLHQVDGDMLPERGLELHALSSASKPVAGWTMRDAIQECREACGGHGYLKAAGIGDVRNDHDASLTFEGENHVLIQQTSNWLLKFWPQVSKAKKISTPLESANFLSNYRSILELGKFSAKHIGEVCKIETIINAYQWLVCYLLKKFHGKIEKLDRDGMDPFWVKNCSQVFYAKDLAIAFIQHHFLQLMLRTIERASEPSIKAALSNLFCLYGLWSLEKHFSALYQGGYIDRPETIALIQDSILELCRIIKDDAVALIDVIAAPDFVLNSILGSSDGMVYQRLQSEFCGNSSMIARPYWWPRIAQHEKYCQSKF